MIYEFINQRLQTLPELAGKVFPISVNINDVEGAFAVYTFQSSEPVSQDLLGAPHHYTDVVEIDFIGPLYDSLAIAYQNALKVLSVSNLDTNLGEYIFSSTCSSPQPDSFSPDAGLYRRTLRVSIDWCII